MSQIIKAFTGIFMVMILMVTSTGVIGAFCQIQYAQNMHAAMLDEIENSNYATTVLENCFATADEVGYQITMMLYTDEGETISVSSALELPADTSHISMAELVLNYPIEIAFFELAIDKELYGYAR